MRGARRNATHRLVRAGLIPARAGSTLATSLFNRLDGAHPRPCGEHSRFSLGVDIAVGSSPPVRGAHGTATLESVPPGLIPARAGSTNPGRWTDCTSRAHPRPCGEHFRLSSRRVRRLGSSPPVRGARRNLQRIGLERGLIPARAGSTSPRTWLFLTRRAHPRPCGEHLRKRCCRVPGWGSSPPVRGARYHHSRGACPCGEHYGGFTPHSYLMGSSPPVRGAPSARS